MEDLVNKSIRSHVSTTKESHMKYFRKIVLKVTCESQDNKPQLNK